MTINVNDFNSFAEFGRARLSQGAATLDDLVIEWESTQHRDEINAAIREGIDDIEAGRHRPAAEVMADLRKKHNLHSE